MDIQVESHNTSTADCCVISNGWGGHGWFEPAIFLFPFGTIGLIMQDTLTLPFIILAVLQYPTYGFVIDKTAKQSYHKWVVIGLFIGHIIVIAMVFFFSSDAWKQS